MGTAESQTVVIVFALLGLVNPLELLGFGLVLGNVCKESCYVICLQASQPWIPEPAPLEVAGE